MKKQEALFINTVEVANDLGVVHSNLLRTVHRMINHGMEDHFFENSFTNKQNRTYVSYDMTEKAFDILEAIYIMSDKTLIEEKSNKISINNDVVYFITNNRNAYKIGFTNNLKTRLSAIQLGCETYCEVVATLKGSKELETLIHKHFEDKRLSGEWFNITEEDVYMFLSQNNYKTKVIYHDTISSLIFDLWHTSSSKIEPNIEELYKVNTKNRMRTILKIIKKGVLNNLSYEEIYSNCLKAN